MDGVIVDTEPVHRYAFFRHFAELGIEVSDTEYAKFTGSSTQNVYQQLKNQYGLTDGIDELMARKREFFNRAFDEKPDLYLLGTVRELIEDLHAHNFQLILASSASKGTIGRVMKRFELYPYFEHVISGEDFTYSKPDPAIFEHAASLAVGSKQECIIIEDSTNGIAAGKAAGIYCIGYNSEHSAMQDLSQADQVIHDFSELNATSIAAIEPKA